MASLTTNYHQMKRRLKKNQYNEPCSPDLSLKSASNPQMQTPSPASLSAVSSAGNDENYSIMSNVKAFASPEKSASPAPTSKLNEKMALIPSPTPSTMQHHERPSQGPPTIENIEEELEALLCEIRTAGLRKGRENCLIDLTHEIRQTIRVHQRKFQSLYKAWVLFAEESNSKANLSLTAITNLKADHELKSNEQLRSLQKLYDVNDGLKDVIEKLKSELKHKDEARLTQQRAHSDHLAAKDVESKKFVEKEVAKMKAKLAKEFERKAAKCVGSVENEYRKKMRILDDKLDMQSKEKLVILEEMADLKEKLDFLNKQNMQLKKDEEKRLKEGGVREMENERIMSGCLEETRRLTMENARLKEENERIMREKEFEVAEQRDRRRTELSSVEGRVKEVMKKKDAEIACLRDDLEESGKRIAEFQIIMKSLNEGFER